MLTFWLVVMALTSFIGGFMTYMVIWTIWKKIDRYLLHRSYVKAVRELNEKYGSNL